MIDTAQVIHDTIYIHSAEALEMMAKTHSFYDSAWERLIQVIIWSFAIIGIAMPIAIQIYQRGRFALMKKSLKQSIKNEFNIEISNLSKKMKKKSKRMTARSMAGVFYLQANNSYDNKDFESAYESFYHALCYFYYSRDYSNLRGTLLSLGNTVKRLNKGAISNINNTKSIKLKKKLKKIENDTKAHSYDDVQKFTAIYNEVMQQQELPF